MVKGTLWQGQISAMPDQARAMQKVRSDLQGTCLTCKANEVKSTYIGESHRSLFDRSSEHEAALRSKNQTYAVVKHWEEVHPQMRTPPKYNYQVIKSHKSAFERQVWDAVLINH